MIHLINPKHLISTCDLITKHINDGGFTFFIEVTNPKVYSHYTGSEFEGKVYFVDPQHTVAGTPNNLRKPEDCGGYSAILYAYMMCEDIYQSLPSSGEILYIIEKPDMDAIGALVLVQWITQTGWEFPYMISQETRERIRNIDALDAWKQPVEWSPSYKQDYQVNWTNILGCNISDFKRPIEDRVADMANYLERGDLNQTYVSQIETEQKLLKESTVESFNGVTVVTTKARGASGLIYNVAPYGIAYNPEMPDAKGNIAPKFTVMEFTGEKYLQLGDIPAVVNEEGEEVSPKVEGFFSYMSRLYPQVEGTWGGNVKAGVGGSPTNCTLKPEVVASELAKFVKP